MRTPKQGLDYFPLDCYMDDKIELIEAKHGLTGFGVIIKLYQRIYRTNGYYYDWTEREVLVLKKAINVDINTINVIINDCLKWGVFDEKSFKTHNILTSRGIQSRYFNAVSRRTKVVIFKEYLLTKPVNINAIYVSKKAINADNMQTETPENVCKSTQSRVDKSRLYKRDILSKDTIRKIFPDDIINLVHEFYKFQSAKYPKDLNGWKKNQSLLNNSYDTIDKLMRIDKYTLSDIKETLLYAVNDEDFWASQVKSLARLRAKSSRNGLMKFINIRTSMESAKTNKTKVEKNIASVVKWANDG